MNSIAQHRRLFANFAVAFAIGLRLNGSPATAGDNKVQLNLAPERVEKIKAYLASQKCPEPEIDAENYGVREAVPNGRFYYGWTLDPLPQLKGFDLIGHMPDRDASDTKSTFFSAGLEMGNMLGEDIVPYLAAAGFKRARLDFAWRKMETQKGVYDFSEADRRLRWPCAGWRLLSGPRQGG